MTTSTNRERRSGHDRRRPQNPGGAIADALTLIRILVTPIVMAILIVGWPDPYMALTASFLFIIAALTDVLDDVLGGSAVSHLRRFGYLDDAADTILIVGSLIALSIVLWQNGLYKWGFAIPAIIIVGREVFIGIARGYELSKQGWPDNLLSNLKGAMAMLGICLLIASPWLTQWIDATRAQPETIYGIYNTASPYVWIAGQLSLWVSAILSVISAVHIMKAVPASGSD